MFDALGNPAPNLIDESYLSASVNAKLNKTDDFSKDVTTWDPDLGSTPIQVNVAPFVADAFSFALDTAIYTDVFLDSLYDQTRALIFRYMYQTEGPETDEIKIELGYMFIGSDTAPGTSYTTITDYFSPDGTSNIRTREISIPAQTGLGINPVVTLKFSRLGSSDASNKDFNLIKTQVYQS